MKEIIDNTTEKTATGYVCENRLTTDALTELVSLPEAWKPVSGLACDVRDRVKERLIKKLRKRA